MTCPNMHCIMHYKLPKFLDFSDFLKIGVSNKERFG